MTGNEMKARMIVTEESIVPPSWFDGKKNKTVLEWGQREYDLGAKAGNENGLKTAQVYLLNRAAEVFLQGKDAEAMLIRRLASEVFKK